MSTATDGGTSDDVGASSDPLAGLAFLLGAWRGTGTWGDGPLACRTAISRLLGRYVQIDVAAEQPGRAAHAERVIVHEDGPRLAAVLFPDRGDVQHFDVLVGDGVVRFLHTPEAGSGLAAQRWTITQTDAGYDEIYEVAPGGRAFQTSVRCSYVPDGSDVPARTHAAEEGA